jgi:hypothetical protein
VIVGSATPRTRSQWTVRTAGAVAAALLVVGPLAFGEARWQLEHVTGARTLPVGHPAAGGYTRGGLGAAR